MLAEKFAIAGCEYIRRRRRRAQHIAESIDAAAFKIDAGKQRGRDALLAIAQQTPGLAGILDVAGEQNHSRRLNTLQQGIEARRHLRAIEAEDQKLADSGWAAFLFLRRHSMRIMKLYR